LAEASAYPDPEDRFMSGDRLAAGAMALALALSAPHAGAAVELKRYAYALADQPTAAAYIPNPLYATQTVGTGIRISRITVGAYQVRFLGFHAGAAPGGTVQVTAFNTSDHCNLASWIASGNDLLVNVRCWRTGNQTPVDRSFTVMVLYR
jgi:hypothetical protein